MNSKLIKPYKEQKKCRICESEELKTYLSLGMMPLANNLNTSTLDSINADRFPLEVLECQECGLKQLSIVIDKDLLYSNYVYRSSMSETYKKHCFDMACYIYPILKDQIESLQYSNLVHIDIAGNDGALIEEFKKAFGENYKPINIEPASNIAGISAGKGINTLNDFFPVKQRALKAHLITATNVIAHVDNVTEFIQGIYDCLFDKGIAVVEFPDFGYMQGNNEYDTVYFEHLSYFTAEDISIHSARLGFEIIGQQFFPEMHGGTSRIIMQKQPKRYEKSDMQRKAETNKKEIKEWVETQIENGKTIVGFGAAAKGNTIINYLELTDKEIKLIIDETPEKIGKYSPGAGIEIVGIDWLNENDPDYIVIFPWNFKDEIIPKLEQRTTKAKFVTFIPDLKVRLRKDKAGNLRK